MDTHEGNQPQTFSPEFLNHVTRTSLKRINTVEFAGFLVHEDDYAIYVADRQGTWVVPRAGIAFVESWEAGDRCVPDLGSIQGRPVRVGIRDGTTIHEIRPWLVEKAPEGVYRNNTRRVVDTIFTLSGPGLPISEQTFLGENQVAALERAFARRLGWNPSSPCDDPVGKPNPAATISKTIVCTGEECWWGYTDSDEGF